MNFSIFVLLLIGWNRSSATTLSTVKTTGADSTPTTVTPYDAETPRGTLPALFSSESSIDVDSTPGFKPAPPSRSSVENDTTNEFDNETFTLDPTTQTPSITISVSTTPTNVTATPTNASTTPTNSSVTTETPELGLDEGVQFLIGLVIVIGIFALLLFLLLLCSRRPDSLEDRLVMNYDNVSSSFGGYIVNDGFEDSWKVN